MSSVTNFAFPPENTVSHNPESSKYKVLIVEDDADIARFLLTTLTRAGLECRHAPDGRIALEALNGERFHLMLLDLTLPEVSGQEICRQVSAVSTMPVMVVTAQDAVEAQSQCFRLGADDFITKPFSTQVLMLRVMALLRRAYIYDAPKLQKTEAPAENSLPNGWNRCDACNYLGPGPKFEQQDANGRRIIACPNCGDTAHVEFALS